MSLIPGVGEGEDMNQYSNTPSPTLSDMKFGSKTRKDEVPNAIIYLSYRSNFGMTYEKLYYTQNRIMIDMLFFIFYHHVVC